MKTLNSFISEATRSTGGRFKNSGADIMTSLILPWIRATIDFNSSQEISDDKIVSAIALDGDRYVLDVDKAISHYSFVTAHIIGDAEQTNIDFIIRIYHLINPSSKISLGPALDHIKIISTSNRLQLKIHGKVSDVDVKRIFDAFSESTMVQCDNIGLTSIKNIRVVKGTGMLDINNNDVRSFAGGENVRCNSIYANNNRNLTSLKGLGSDEIYVLRLSGCTNLKTLKGLPPLRDKCTIELHRDPSLSIADGGFRDLVKGKKTVRNLSIDTHIFSDINSRDIWGDIDIDTLSVYASDPNLTLPDNFLDLIPPVRRLRLDGGYVQAGIKKQMMAWKRKKLTNFEVVYA